MTHEEAKKQQLRLAYNDNEFFSVRQEHDSIGEWYLMPTTKEEFDKEMLRDLKQAVLALVESR